MESLGMTRRTPGPGLEWWGAVLLRPREPEWRGHEASFAPSSWDYETRFQPETGRMPVLHSLADSHQNLSQLFRRGQRLLMQLDQGTDLSRRFQQRQRQL